MLYILSYSWKTWATTAAIWLLFVAALNELAKAGDPVEPGAMIRATAASASHVLGAFETRMKSGPRQVAKVELKDFDLSTIDDQTFGDHDR